MTTLLPLTVLGPADGPLETRTTRPGHDPVRSRLTSEVFVVPSPKPAPKPTRTRRSCVPVGLG
jgi:hypothetical protein